ncbi:MAG: dockerin type I repeat-containing protein [Oscillospiraceae bacterium]|nr:dockerin type I repeat-containing protein [Oscillospiraceae bacterium]
MKKTSRISAGLTAFVMTGMLMNLLPVSAEAPDDCFIVETMQSAGCWGLLHCMDADGQVSTEPVKFWTEERITGGDVLTIDGDYQLDGTNIRTLTLPEDVSFTRNPEGSQLAVKYVQITNIDSGVFELTDSEGNTYSYAQADSEFFKSSLSLEYAGIGDIYQFAFYHDTPVRVTGTEPAPDLEPFMIITGKEKDRYIGQYYDTVRTGLTTTGLIKSKMIYLPEEEFASEIQDIQYGDVFTIGDDYFFTDSEPAEVVYFDGGYVNRIGTASDQFELKKLTLTSGGELHVYPADGSTVHRSIGEYVFTDSEGNQYPYRQEYDKFDYEISLENAQIGDVYTFAVYDDTALLPVRETVQPENFNADEFFIVTNVAAEDHYMLEYYYPKELSVTNYAHRKLYFTGDLGDHVSYGDIFLADGGFETTAMENYRAVYTLTLDEETTLTKIGNCSDLMEHKTLTAQSEVYDGAPVIPSFRIFTYHLTDEAGTEYYYSIEDSFSSDIPMRCQKGTEREFAFYRDSAIIPLPESEEIIADTSGNQESNPDFTGDADGNGITNVLDVIVINKAVLGKEAIQPEQIKYMDYNNNQIPDSTDALNTLKTIVGLA